MKQDLDRLMGERNIDALFILANEGENSYRDYITGGVDASAMVIKKQGEQPVLIVNGMELDEAKKSGLKVYTYNDFDSHIIMQQYDTAEERSVALWRRFCEDLGISGQVAFYGHGDVMGTWKTLRRLERHLDDIIEIVEDEDPNIFSMARSTKDAGELEKLAAVGQATGAAMRETRAWLAAHKVQDKMLVKADGSPLTIGDVKTFVNKALLERNLVDDSGMIFAQGADAGMPHSRGEADEPLQLGKTIVFDLFPKNLDNGYYHDMTRTWCLGYASDEVRTAYDLVMHAFTQSLEGLTVNEPTSTLQDLVCDIFEEHGHPTPRSQPGTQEGYVHSLGHGIGLEVHEAPSMGKFGPTQKFQPGHVVTIEPGLYYPSKGWGIRIEDTVAVDQHGQLVNFTDCPYDLVIEMDS